ncbi:MAG: glutaredoxin family protein [Candidatus Nanopelagicales bacterium]
MLTWRRRRSIESTSREPRIVLIGRAGCHLCDEAETIIARVAAETGTTWVKRSIDEDPQVQARWKDHIPVTLIDGQPHDFYRVSEARLRAALRS